MVNIYCDICESLIARVDKLSDLEVPVHGSQFKPPYDGMDDVPFNRVQRELIMCPVCRNCPFLYDDRIKIYEDKKFKHYNIVKFICFDCGASFKTEAALKAHITREKKKAKKNVEETAS